MIILVFSAPVAEMADACTCEFGYSENVEIIYRSLEASAEFDCIVSAKNSFGQMDRSENAEYIGQGFYQ
ncbi:MULTISPECIES: hypothetical protein [Enterobacteriaceae]|uniref:hypothetical protein n=1 Tax=Enterobacteriaceae TaxID=543 RepID=UPI000A4D9BF2|nr:MULTISPECIES: hypothetical protein [Enterobacteriaceae]MDM3154830.1 hypothetical protein [Citrobacter sp. Cf122]BDT26404.1 hypothetical protein CF204P1_51270 [Citrobacter freundii]